MPEEKEEEPELNFFERIWATSKIKIIVFFSWLVFVVLVTEIYLSIGNHRDEVYAEGDPLPYEKMIREQNNNF